MKTIIEKYTAYVLNATWILLTTRANAQHMNMDFALRRNVLWYEQPWVWITASCIFLFMIVWLLRQSDRKK
jgi:hypothetical protein